MPATMLPPDLVASAGTRGPVPPATAGVRDRSGRGVPYVDDPVRVPSARFIPNGYLRGGYDTGRVW